MVDELFAGARQVSLHTGDPGTTGANEVSTSNTGYSRAAIPEDEWNAASAGEVTNDGAKQVGTATANWGSISHYGIWDGATLLVTAEFSSATTVNSGDTVTIQDEGVGVTLSSS